MKILIVQNTDWIRRNPAQQHHLAELLSLVGHEIRVVDFEILWSFSPRSGYISKRTVFQNVSKIHEDAKVTVYRPGIIKLPLLDYVSFMFSAFREVTRQIKIFSPDVIVGLGIVAFIGGSLAKLYGLPFIYYWIDVSHRLIPVRFVQPVGRIIQYVNVKLADKIIVINRKLGEYVIAIGGSLEQVKVLGAGIYFDKFNPSVNGKEARKTYKIKENDVVLFFMGWLYRFSGLKEVFLKLAERKDTDVKLLIVGDGDLYNELRDISKKYGLTGRVILTGRKPYSEIPSLIAISDICLLPAYPFESVMRDIVPIKIYEYMAMGKPVVSTKLPGVVAEFGENNGIFYVNKPEDVIDKALELIDDIQFRRFGMQARNFVRRYDWNSVTKNFEEILKSIQGDS